jgi:hypothetical protein
MKIKLGKGTCVWWDRLTRYRQPYKVTTQFDSSLSSQEQLDWLADPPRAWSPVIR